MMNSCVQLNHTMQRKISVQAQAYDNDDFRTLYRHIKSLNMLNYLYIEGALSKEEFDKEEEDILQRFFRLKESLEKGNYDLDRFASLYGIEKDFKRVRNPDKSSGDNKPLLSIMIPEIFETIHEAKLVRDIINLLSEVNLLLNKLKQRSKNMPASFIECIQKINALNDEIKQKSVHQELSSYELYNMEDAMTKMKLEFQQFSDYNSK